MAQNLDAAYPTIARWVMEYGWMEIGHDNMSQSFVRALDEGGLVWEGQEDYATLDDALRDLERQGSQPGCENSIYESGTA